MIGVMLMLALPKKLVIYSIWLLLGWVPVRLTNIAPTVCSLCQNQVKIKGTKNVSQKKLEANRRALSGVTKPDWVH